MYNVNQNPISPDIKPFPSSKFNCLLTFGEGIQLHDNLCESQQVMVFNLKSLKSCSIELDIFIHFPQICCETWEQNEGGRTCQRNESQGRCVSLPNVAMQRITAGHPASTGSGSGGGPEV